MKIITAPTKISWSDFDLSIFLAGTIDNGTSIDWQKPFIEQIQKFDDSLSKPLGPNPKIRNQLALLNPRRDDWVLTITQRSFDIRFREQVEWELAAMENASIIIMYFVPNSLSPITLLELGLFAKTHKILVCCPDEFWRKGNVEIVCEQNNIPIFKMMEDLIQHTKTQIIGHFSQIW